MFLGIWEWWDDEHFAGNKINPFKFIASFFYHFFGWMNIYFWLNPLNILTKDSFDLDLAIGLVNSLCVLISSANCWACQRYVQSEWIKYRFHIFEMTFLAKTQRKIEIHVDGNWKRRIYLDDNRQPQKLTNSTIFTKHRVI